MKPGSDPENDNDTPEEAGILMLLGLIRSLRRALDRHEVARTLIRQLILLVVLSLCFVATFKTFEGPEVTWTEAVWQAWQTNTTVGYGNRPAQTGGGRLATIVFGTLGIALVGVCISGAFDLKQVMADMRRYGMRKNPFEGGYVIMNFPGAAAFRMLAREILTVEKGVGLCVVDSRLEELPGSVTSEFDRLHFVRGGALEASTYEQAGVRNSKAVLVFPLDRATADSDGATLTTVNILRRHTGPNTRIIPILVSPENEELFDDIGGAGGVKATAVWQNLDILAVVQECQDEHSAELIAHLMSNRVGANPETLPAGPVAGLTWSEFVCGLCAVSRESSCPANPLGIIRADGRVDPCPAADARIEPDDCLSIIAFPGFDWDTFGPRVRSAATRS